MVVCMNILVPAAATALLLAGAAHAQTPPDQTSAARTPAPSTAPVSTLTRDLNSGPPAPAVYLAPAPEPVVAQPVAPPPPAATITPAPRPTTPAPSVAPTPLLPPPGTLPPRVTPIPTTPAPQPRMVPITPPEGAVVPATVPPTSAPFTPPAASPAPAPTVPLEAVVATPPAPAAPAVTVLDSAARAALPFTADLPPGFEIVTGRPGPDFRIYTIRRGARSFVMVYAGPSSQFPIYSGQMVEAAGRASILATEDGVRHAVEHLFQRTAAPREIHVWTMSLDGADRDLAEQIAQSVDVR
jgi:hypothetical protein